jgi:hypothetical protein
VGPERQLTALRAFEIGQGFKGLLDHLIITGIGGDFFSFKDNKTQSSLQTERKKYGMKQQRKKVGEHTT